MTTRYIVAIGLFIFGLFVLYLSRSILSTVIIAALITFLVKPIIIFLNTKLRSPKGLTIAIVYFIVVTVILVAPLILLPPLVTAFNTFLSYDYQTLLQDVIVWAELTLLDLKLQQSVIPGLDPLVDSTIDPLLQVVQDTEPITIPQLPPVPDILAFLSGALSSGVNIAISVVGTVVSSLITLAFIVMFSIYMSIDSEKFYKSFIEFIPAPYRQEADTLLTRVARAMGAWLRGNITLMVVIGVTVWIGNLILGTPNAFFLGVISGLLELIPTIGPAIALIPAVLVALTQGSSNFDVSNFTFAIMVLIFYLLVQVLENNFVVPRVMGQELKLHPLVVLIGILVGAASFGVLGALLAAPVIAMAKIVLNYLYMKVLGEDPFPPQVLDAEEPKSSWFDKTKDVTGRVSSLILRRTRKGEAASMIDETSAEPELKDQEPDHE
jgi:predicted PurR-regulated permease PerM